MPPPASIPQPPKSPDAEKIMAHFLKAREAHKKLYVDCMRKVRLQRNEIGREVRSFKRYWVDTHT